MSYFILESFVEPNEKLADFEPYDEFDPSWLSGAAFENAPPNPIELVWDADNEDGVRVDYYQETVHPMHKNLISALRNIGVDNLDTYPVVIRSTTGKPDCYDYEAVNIIGTIAAADMEESEIDDMGLADGLVDVSFDSLVIDEAKANGCLLFRLAENVGTVVVHSKVVKHLNEVGGFRLTFTNPEDYQC